MSVGAWILIRMTHPLLDRLTADLGALAAEWAGARPSLGAAEAAGFSECSGPGLVRIVAAAARVRRGLDALIARASDEIAKRSTSEFGGDGLAKQHGFSSPARLLAAATGGAQAEASRLLAVGEATRERSSFTGETLPAKFEHVRVALDGGAISVEAAAAITGMLRRVEVRADTNVLGPYEAKLVEVASNAPLSLVMRAVKLAEARLDADGAAPADERRFDDRSLTLHEDGDGVLHLRARLDPVTAAPVKAALDALVGDALRRRTGDRPGDARSGEGRAGRNILAPAPIEDRRSIPQMQADALSELAKHALGCRHSGGALPKTTVVVRMSLEALRTGVGLAEIDGIDRPIAAGTVRKLAADAELIPMVLGGESLPLDVGRATRLFTRAQRIALAERGGGCASCGANITYAEAHHIDWWRRDHGSTDLANGVMLCSHCHHQVHDHGWGIRVDGGSIWFIPPPHIDPRQQPRLGGRARFDPSVDLNRPAPPRLTPPRPAPHRPAPHRPASDRFDRPDPGARGPHAPRPGVPDPDAPDLDEPDLDEPGPGAPDLGAPGLDEPGPGVHGPGVPDPDAPGPGVPDPDAPGPGVPDPDALEPLPPDLDALQLQLPDGVWSMSA
jgi:hypothetical protein